MARSKSNVPSLRHSVGQRGRHGACAPNCGESLSRRWRTAAGKSVELALQYRKYLQDKLDELSGVELGSAVRRINTLSGRIEEYRDHKPQVGVWEFKIAFYTEGSDEVEKLSHRLLEAHADHAAPFGEVFCCSVTDATAAVEAALMQAGLVDTAKKVTELRPTSRTFQCMNSAGNCVLE